MRLFGSNCNNRRILLPMIMTWSYSRFTQLPTNCNKSMLCYFAIFVLQFSVALSYSKHGSFKAHSIVSNRHPLTALLSSIDSNPSSSATTNTQIIASTVQLKSFFDYVTTSHVSNDFQQIHSKGLELLSKMKPPTTKDEAWR